MSVLKSIVRPLSNYYNTPINNLRELDDVLYTYFSKNYDNLKKIPYNLYQVDNILSRYNGNDWQNYKLYDKNASYLKNVFSSRYNQQLYAIIIISWNKNKYIKIHNHADNGCSFKILEGNLEETIYDKSLNKLGSKQLHIGTISSIHNNIGFHSITTKENNAYSLHIYSPFDYKTQFLE